MESNQWPLNYKDVLAERIDRFNKINGNAALEFGAKEYYRDSPYEFIEDWCITYDPRNSLKNNPTTMPFIMFQRQHEFVDFLLDCLEGQEDGLVEKSRDMGATWVCCAFSVWLWLFKAGTAVGWGSRKEQLVDRIGDPDSIFEKMRMIIDNLPRFLWPIGFNPKDHLSYMKIINPETGATITGEAGDNIGRGGRSSLYFKDESAYYERPELIESALGDNTNVQIDISSVHGTNNIFYRRRQAGEIWTKDKKIEEGTVRVFIFDWHDHPLKDQAWYDKRRKKAEREGRLASLAREVDRDYSASVDGIIIPAKWIKACVDAHITLGIKEEGMTYGGLDVADEGGDLNAFGARKGVIIKHVEAWAEGDTGETANKAVDMCIKHKVNSLQYDCIGVGSGIKAETNRLRREGLLPKSLDIVPWNAASSPLFPDSPAYEQDDDDDYDEAPILNKDLYSNLKAQAWWNMRDRCYRTYRAVMHGAKYEHDELISIPSSLENREELIAQLSQPTYIKNGAGKIVVDKKPKGAKSPNMADAVIEMFTPIEVETSEPDIW
jgi:hypothetical protein